MDPVLVILEEIKALLIGRDPSGTNMSDFDREFFILEFIKINEKLDNLKTQITQTDLSLKSYLFDDITFGEYNETLINFAYIRDEFLYVQEQIDNLSLGTGTGGGCDCATIEQIIGQLQGDINTYFGQTNLLINDTKQAILDKDCCPILNEYEQVTIDAQPWYNSPKTYHGLAPLSVGKIINEYDINNQWVTSKIEVYDGNNELINVLIKHGDHSPYGALESYTTKFEPYIDPNNPPDPDKLQCEYFNKLMLLMNNLLREIKNKDCTFDDTLLRDFISNITVDNTNYLYDKINEDNYAIKVLIENKINLLIQQLSNIESLDITTLVNNINTLLQLNNEIKIAIDDINVNVDFSPIIDLLNNISIDIEGIDSQLNVDFNPVFNAILDLKNYIDFKIGSIDFGNINFSPILDLLNNIDFKVGNINIDFKPIIDLLHDIEIIIKGIDLNIDFSPIFNLINNLDFSINNKIEIKGNEVIDDIDKNIRDVNFYTKPMFEKKAFINDIYLSIDWQVIGSKSRYPDRIVLNPNLTLDWDDLWENTLKNLTWQHGEVYAHVPAKDKTVSICQGYYYDNQEAIKVLTTLGNLSTLEKLSDTDFIRFNYGASKVPNSTNNTQIVKLTCYSLTQDKILFSYTRNKGKIV